MNSERQRIFSGPGPEFKYGLYRLLYFFAPQTQLETQMVGGQANSFLSEFVFLPEFVFLFVFGFD